MYQPETGDIDGVAYRQQMIALAAGNYVLDNCGVAIGNSSTAVETLVASGVVAFGYERVAVDDQTLTHPSGPPGDPADPDADWRVDAVVVTDSGTASVIEGTPGPLRAGTDDSNTSRRPPKTTSPLPPPVGADVALVAHVIVPPGSTSSEALYDDYVIDRRIAGSALNNLELIPGRAIQQVLDNAREGQTLTADRSQTIVLNQPLVVGTPNVTIEGLNVRYADQAATSDSDDMLTLAADGITVDGMLVDGNAAGQGSVEPDAIAVEASDCTVRGIDATAVSGHVVNVNGGSQSVGDTLIRNVRAADCAKDAVIIQGSNTFRTTAEVIRSERSGTRGTVTVRNGARYTSISDVHGYQQDYTAQIEDFGGVSGSTAATVGTIIDDIRGVETDEILANGTSEGVEHLGLSISKIRGRRFGGSSGGLVDVSNIGAASVSDMFINDPFTDQWGIFGSNCPAVNIYDCFVRSYGTGGVVISDTTGIRIVDSSFGSAPGDGQIGRGIYISAANRPVRRALIRGNIVTEPGSDAVHLRDNGRSIESAIVTENFYDSIRNDTSSTNVVVSNNLPAADP